MLARLPRRTLDDAVSPSTIRLKRASTITEIRIQGLYQNLEGKVQEKTERLEAQRARLEALYESAAFVARADTLEALAKGIARQVRRVARADASEAVNEPRP